MGTLAPRWDVKRDAGTLRVPILLALGRHDYTVPYALWNEVAPLLPDATVHIFERSGHQPFFEEPETFASAVLDWMASRQNRNGPRGV
jgi:pimeloyl-ACP methyl ester carboxylesterase